MRRRIVVSLAAAAAIAAMCVTLFVAVVPWNRRSVRAPEPEAAPEAQPLAEEAPPADEEGASPAPARQRSRLRGLLGWAVYLAFVVAAVVFTPRIMSSLLSTDYPMAAVTSSSMWPALHKGDMVILKGVESPADLQVGDIIGFKQADGGFAIHRIVQLHGDKITTKGDANKDPDPVVDFSSVVGRVPHVAGKLVKVRYLGYLGILVGGGIGHNTTDAVNPGPPVFEGADESRGVTGASQGAIERSAGEPQTDAGPFWP